MKTLQVLKYIGFGILGAGFVILAILLVMILWNWLIPNLLAWNCRITSQGLTSR